MLKAQKRSFYLILFLVFALTQQATAGMVRIKDLGRLQGVRDNQLIGYGLVVGLEGTGDKDPTTMQTVANMLNNFGITVDNSLVKTKNTAAVIITATIPPFIKTGSKIDVTVSSFGGAKSLQGGTLLQTPLYGADNKVYVVAQGAISIGGFNIGTGGGGKVQKNHVTVARIPDGGIVEQEIEMEVLDRGSVSFSLKESNYTTVDRVVNTINDHFKIACAQGIDARTIKVYIPRKYMDNTISFISQIEDLAVVPDSVARVIINEKTGTVVISNDVSISTVAVSHGDLTITIKEELKIVQPPSFSEGETVVAKQKKIEVAEKQMKLVLLEKRCGYPQGCKTSQHPAGNPQGYDSHFSGYQKSRRFARRVDFALVTS